MALCWKFSRPYKAGLQLQRYENSLFCHKKKDSLPLNGPEGDWKMTLICHNPYSDNNFFISWLKSEKSQHGSAPLWRSDRSSEWSDYRRTEIWSNCKYMTLVNKIQVELVHIQIYLTVIPAGDAGHWHELDKDAQGRHFKCIYWLTKWCFQRQDRETFVGNIVEKEWTSF